jgi:hypothetical protein
MTPTAIGDKCDISTQVLLLSCILISNEESSQQVVAIQNLLDSPEQIQRSLKVMEQLHQTMIPVGGAGDSEATTPDAGEKKESGVRFSVALMQPIMSNPEQAQKALELAQKLKAAMAGVKDVRADGAVRSAAEPEEPGAVLPCAGGCGFYGTATLRYCPQCRVKNLDNEKSIARNWMNAEQVGTHLCKPCLVDEMDTPEQLVVGAAVQIHGLQGAQELNGRSGRIVKYVQETSRFVVKLKGTEGTKALKVSNLRRLGGVEVLKIREKQRDKHRCWHCSRKCGLSGGFECQCGYVFCSRHRYAEDHDCSFDHMRKGREALSKENPKVEANAFGFAMGGG